MTFGDAIEAMKKGKKVAREGWNGKGLYIYIHSVGFKAIDGIPVQRCIWMKTAQNTWQPGWHASQADILSEDWEVVE